MARERYTKYPRPILWLVPGGELPSAKGSEGGKEVEPFYISKFPVTNEQFEAFDPGYQRCHGSPGARDPAVAVSLEEAQEYCDWYSQVSRKAMRLPTEKEWEYACRAGSGSRFFWGDDPAPAEEFLWDGENSQGRLHPADAKRANGFGLFGMLGGVWEWVAPQAGNQATLRGGSHLTPRADISCSLRRTAGPSERFDDAGFRIVKSFR
jgi:formylglycine-generating enzyme required for sulfatase activity